MTWCFLIHALSCHETTRDFFLERIHLFNFSFLKLWRQGLLIVISLLPFPHNCSYHTVTYWILSLIGNLFYHSLKIRESQDNWKRRISCSFLSYKTSLYWVEGNNSLLMQGPRSVKLLYVCFESLSRHFRMVSVPSLSYSAGKKVPFLITSLHSYTKNPDGNEPYHNNKTNMTEQNSRIIEKE